MSLASFGKFRLIRWNNGCSKCPFILLPLQFSRNSSFVFFLVCVKRIQDYQFWLSMKYLGKIFQKLLFLIPWYVHLRVRLRWLRNVNFLENCVPNKWIPYQYSANSIISISTNSVLLLSKWALPLVMSSLKFSKEAFHCSEKLKSSKSTLGLRSFFNKVLGL